MPKMTLAEIYRVYLIAEATHAAGWIEFRRDERDPGYLHVTMHHGQSDVTYTIAGSHVVDVRHNQH